MIQIQITGRGAGVFYVEFTKDQFVMEPYSYEGADAYVATSFDNLVALSKGKASPDKLLMSGQLKLTGNLSKGAEIKALLGV